MEQNSKTHNRMESEIPIPLESKNQTEPHPKRFSIFILQSLMVKWVMSGDGVASSPIICYFPHRATKNMFFNTTTFKNCQKKGKEILQVKVNFVAIDFRIQPIWDRLLLYCLC